MAVQELPPPHSSSSDHRHLTEEILLPLNSLDLRDPLRYRAPLPALFLILFVLCLLLFLSFFLCVLLGLFPVCIRLCYCHFFCCIYLSSSSSSSRSFSYFPSHLARSSSISKQTHFLLTLGSVAVICCACQVEYWATLWPLSTKGRPRKPEGRRYLCIGWIISPARHSAFSHCLACNRHAEYRCQDSSHVTSTRHNACHASLHQLTLVNWILHTWHFQRDSRVLTCFAGILVSLTLWTMSNIIFLI